MHGRYWAIVVLLCCRISGRLILTGQQLRFYLTMAPHSFAWTLGVVQTLYTETTIPLDCNKDRREQIQDIHQTFKRFWFHSLSKVLLLTCVTKCFYQMFFTKCLPNVFPIVLPSDFTKWQFESPCESYLDHNSVNKKVFEILKTF